MDDLLKGLAIGFFAFSLVHGSLETRVRHNAARQTFEAFDKTGKVWAKVEPRGTLGLFVNDVWAVDVYGQGITTERIPFYLYPKGGWKGSIRHLRLHLKDFTLRGLPIEEFEADIPFAKYDLGHAAWKGRLHLRAAEPGTGFVRVGAKGLQSFILRKFQPTLSDVEVLFHNQKFSVRGKVRILSVNYTPFEATGNLIIREGRFVDLDRPLLSLNGLPVSPSSAAIILKQINPVLDVEADLGLKGFFLMTDIGVGENALTIRGRVTIPLEPSQRPPEAGKE